MITTKTGDQGQTTCGNKRVDKDDVLVKTVGVIDELLAKLGWLRSRSGDSLKSNIYEIQLDLMKISGVLACDQKFEDLKSKVEKLESEIELLEKELPPLTSFLVPGETELEAITHIARTIARRAERKIVSLNKVKKIDREILKYFNRLSDYLFLVARQIKN